MPWLRCHLTRSAKPMHESQHELARELEVNLRGPVANTMISSEETVARVKVLTRAGTRVA
eukprot:6637691-Pyramimonas_sp.AAC.1